MVPAVMTETTIIAYVLWGMTIGCLTVMLPILLHRMFSPKYRSRKRSEPPRAPPMITGAYSQTLHVGLRRDLWIDPPYSMTNTDSGDTL